MKQAGQSGSSRRASAHKLKLLGGLAVALLTVVGCAVGGWPGISGPPKQRAANLEGNSGDLAQAQIRLRRLVPASVIDDLYFPMMDAPYDRATIAVALQTSQALTQDTKLQRHDAERFSDKQRRLALGWITQALDRLGTDDSPTPPAPEEVDWNRWLGSADRQSDQPTCVFAFIDRTHSGPGSTKFGGFDQVICTGQPIYPVTTKTQDVSGLERYADALEVGLISVGGGQARLASSGSGSIRGKSIREVITQPNRTGRGSALIDFANGESWGGMLARRALWRGATGNQAYDAIGISTPPGNRSSLAQRARAAMWVQAFDGQRLGLVEGWSDGRDTFPSRLGDPDWLEAVAHTALDIRKHALLLTQFEGQRRFSVIVSANAIDARNPNGWNAAFLELTDALVDWQVPFDVAPANRSGANASYPYKMRFKPGADFSASMAAQEASKLLSQRAPELRSIVVTEANGDVAAKLYVRQSNRGKGLGVVNLTGETRRLKLRDPLGKGVSGAFVDQLSGQSIRGQITMQPYGVRLLTRK